MLNCHALAELWERLPIFAPKIALLTLALAVAACHLCRPAFATLRLGDGSAGSCRDSWCSSRSSFSPTCRRRCKTRPAFERLGWWQRRVIRTDAARCRAEAFQNSTSFRGAPIGSGETLEEPRHARVAVCHLAALASDASRNSSVSRVHFSCSTFSVESGAQASEQGTNEHHMAGSSDTEQTGADKGKRSKPPVCWRRRLGWLAATPPSTIRSAIRTGSSGSMERDSMPLRRCTAPERGWRQGHRGLCTLCGSVDNLELVADRWSVRKLAQIVPCERGSLRQHRFCEKKEEHVLHRFTA
jgi:hypothetical protein